ncbi:hypothetical protein KU41_15300 [Clostridium botulinum]|nr:hypothetical protein KU41_15300 [Clostridium botulinum]MBY6802797.1 hypothetical protein [Clostridium botulinum]MBY6812916.1 hypothetical protein [Clostridium botulinum]MBY6818957.1 hypothetical protein [Clostridium botulinum]NFJ49546.1 hypothetical protein [Clostridium botulinum]
MNLTNGLKTQKLYFMKITSFISSMFPLSAFLVLKYNNNYKVILKYIPVNIIINLIFTITLLSLIYIIFFFKIRIPKGHFNRKQYHLRNIVQERTNTSSYLLSNVLPVITLEMDNMYNIIFLIILIFLLGFMYIKNNLFYINPIYDLINIKVYTSQVFENNSNNSKKLFIISCVTLYEFDDNKYEGIRFGDILIISKEIN